MIITSIKHFTENIKEYTELVKNGETVIAKDDESEIVLVKKDKVKGLK